MDQISRRSIALAVGVGTFHLSRVSLIHTIDQFIAKMVLFGSGGIYANLAGLRTIGLSILNFEILSPTTAQDLWMKPRSGAGSLVELVRAPWEITRLMIPVNPASDRTRVCDLYLKAGGNGEYTSIIALSPAPG